MSGQINPADYLGRTDEVRASLAAIKGEQYASRAHAVAGLLNIMSSAELCATQGGGQEAACMLQMARKLVYIVGSELGLQPEDVLTLLKAGQHDFSDYHAAAGGQG